MNIIIQNAQMSDIDTIANLMRLSKAYWGYDEMFLDRFMDIIGIREDYLNQNTVRLVYLDKKLIGFYNFIIHNDNSLELDNFFIHPDYIGKGFGRRMWEHCCIEAKQLGKNEFIIWSDPNAENFYIKMGCQKIGERKSPMMPHRFPPIMKYQLDPANKNNC